MTTLVDSPALRAARRAAYDAGAYRFAAPPVCHRQWAVDDWCNFVRFTDPSLTGFLPEERRKP